MELNSLSNFGRGHHEEHFCGTTLNLDQCSGDILSSGSPFVEHSRTIYAILVGSNTVNISDNFY